MITRLLASLFPVCIGHINLLAVMGKGCDYIAGIVYD